ncbi:MAG: DUF1684 domain-containing protein [Lacunisphaera sp.]|nr:DUF1684 domain-containing protein [Lacunisphaera sp.]
MLPRCLLLALLLTTPAFATDDYAKSVATHRAARVARLTTPTGWLTVVGLHWLSAGDNSVGTAADNALQLAGGPPYLGTVTLAADGKITFTPSAGALVDVDGQQGPAELRYRGEGQPSLVTSGTLSFFVIQRNEKLGLRVKDSAAPARAHFLGLDYFPTDPAWRIAAQWVPFEKPREVNITNIIGQVSPASVPGKAVFTKDGHAYELLPIDEGANEPLFFVVSDQTSGGETYGACRFVYADQPKDGKVVLDFNLAQNPPCAFTPFATCPLPPKENRMPVRVTAGEKNYRGHHE